MSALHDSRTSDGPSEDPSRDATLPIATAGSDTRVIAAVSWIILAIGIVAAALFAGDPSVLRHPGLFLLATTGLVGCASLRVLARLLRDRPVD